MRVIGAFTPCWPRSPGPSGMPSICSVTCSRLSPLLELTVARYTLLLLSVSDQVRGTTELVDEQSEDIG